MHGVQSLGKCESGQRIITRGQSGQGRFTPFQFARQQCANMRPDGQCLGVHWNRMQSHPGCNMVVATPADHCSLADGERCVYFEKLILPLAEQASTELELRKRAQAHDAYMATHTKAELEQGGKCACGLPKEPRKRFCEACRMKRRLEQRRDGMRRSRACGQSSRNGAQLS